MANTVCDRGYVTLKTTYQKSPNALMDVVGGESVLLRSDGLQAIALNDSGSVLWEALDHFDQSEDLVSLLCDARTDISAGEAEHAVQSFLTSLVTHGLATIRQNRRVRRAPDMVTELVGNELLVFTRSSRKVHLLNESGALLWVVLEEFDNSDEMIGLLTEAWPDKSAAEIEEVVHKYLDDLIDSDLAEEVQPGAA
jgi:hypothetical protein